MMQNCKNCQNPFPKESLNSKTGTCFFCKVIEMAPDIPDFLDSSFRRRGPSKKFRRIIAQENNESNTTDKYRT